MAAENIDNTVAGSGLFNTKIPGLGDAADIQAALRLYHYGSYSYDGANTDVANLPNPSIAKHLQNLVDADALEVTNRTAADAAEVVNRNAAISTHNLDTTDVHGIADTSLLATKAYVGNQIDNSVVDQSLLAGTGLDWNSVSEQFEVEPRIANVSTVITKTSSFTLDINDVNKTILLSTSSPMTLTIPANSSVSIPVGYQYNFVEIGTGKTTFSPSSGVVVGSKNSQLFLDGQYSKGTLVKIGTDTWILYGDVYEGVAVVPTPVAPTPVAPTPVAPTPVAPTPVAPTPVAPTPVAPTPVAPTPVAPTPVAPTPVAPTPVAPTPVAGVLGWYASGCCDGVVVHGSSTVSESNALDAMDGFCTQSLIGVTNAVTQYGTDYPSVTCTAPETSGIWYTYCGNVSAGYDPGTVMEPAFQENITCSQKFNELTAMGEIASGTWSCATGTSGSSSVSPANCGVTPTPVAPTPVAPTPVAPTPVVPTPVAPTPVAPTPVAPTSGVWYTYCGSVAAGYDPGTVMQPAFTTQTCSQIFSQLNAMGEISSGTWNCASGTSDIPSVSPANCGVTPTPVAPTPVAPTPVAPTPVAPTPVAPTPVAPTPVAPTPVAPTPVAPTPVAPTPVAAVSTYRGVFCADGAAQQWTNPQSCATAQQEAIANFGPITNWSCSYGTTFPAAPSCTTPTPVAPTPVAPTPVAPTPVAPTPVAPTPVAPTPVAPTPVAPTPVAPTPVAPTPVAPTPVAASGVRCTSFDVSVGCCQSIGCSTLCGSGGSCIGPSGNRCLGDGSGC